MTSSDDRDILCFVAIPACFLSVAASALLLSDAERVVLSYPLTLHAPCQVVTILNNIQTHDHTASFRL